MKKQQGIALVAVLIIMVVVSVLVFGVAFTTRIEQTITRNDSTSTQAFYVAQAGLQKAKTLLFENFRYSTKFPPANLGTGRTACSNILAQGVDWNRNGTLETNESFSNGGVATPLTRSGTVSLAGGTGTFTYYIISDATKPRFMTIKSIGAYGNPPARATVQAVFDVSSGGIFDYAIFTGRGQSNKKLNGGVTIRGGLYAVGDKNRPDTTLIDSTGNMSLLNEYDLTDTSTYGNVKDRVAAADQKAGNLCATLRIQDGRIDVGGSSSYGTPSNKLLGFYVGDYFNPSNSGDPKNDIIGGVAVCQKTKGVCSDGAGVFDLDPATAPKFPDLDTTPCADQPTKTWRTCVQEEATSKGLRIGFLGGVPTLSPIAAAFLNPGSCTSTALGAALAGGALTLDNTKIDCRYAANGESPAGGFLYDPSTTPATLQVYGTLDLAGVDLTFKRAVNYQSNNFEKKGKAGSIVVEKSGGVGGNVRFGGPFLPDAAFATYPSQTIAVMAEADMYQAAPQIMGIMYAGGQFRTVKSQQTFGSVVATEFCTTSAGGATGPCQAGQKAEIVYLDPGATKPSPLNLIQNSTAATFRIVTYERR